MQISRSAVQDSTYELLLRLEHDPHLASFKLVGGTALALQLGHRKSIDLDLFSRSGFDTTEMQRNLARYYGFEGSYVAKNTLKGTIDGVFIDLITYDYPDVEPLVVTPDGIRMASMADIAAMKLEAIVGNGTRPKDFVDVAAMGGKMTLGHMLEVYCRKFSTSDTLSPTKALVYYEDIDWEGEPVELIGGLKFDWKRVKRRLDAMTAHPDVLCKTPLFACKSRDDEDFER